MHGVRPDVPQFIVVHELHFKPKRHTQPFSWSPSRTVSMANLGHGNFGWKELNSWWHMPIKLFGIHETSWNELLKICLLSPQKRKTWISQQVHGVETRLSRTHVGDVKFPSSKVAFTEHTCSLSLTSKKLHPLEWRGVLAQVFKPWWLKVFPNMLGVTGLIFMPRPLNARTVLHSTTSIG